MTNHISGPVTQCMYNLLLLLSTYMYLIAGLFVCRFLIRRCLYMIRPFLMNPHFLYHSTCPWWSIAMMVSRNQKGAGGFGCWNNRKAQWLEHWAQDRKNLYSKLRYDSLQLWVRAVYINPHTKTLSRYECGARGRGLGLGSHFECYLVFRS